MEVLIILQGLVDHISIQHVLVLNLIGWGIKGVMHHKGLEDWTDIIPIILGVLGVLLAFVDPIKYPGNYIIFGLANAGLAWLFHRVIKDGSTIIKQAVKKK
jgi:hypothetical protein